jgi:OmpA-OmpF porin, OOP family
MHTKTLPAVIALGLASAALPAHAQDDDRFYLAPTLSYTFADSDRQADDDWGGGLALGKPVSPNWNLELALSGSTLDLDTGGRYKLWGLGVDGLYFFNRDPRFAPYGVIGLGGLRTEIPGQRDTGFMANAGVGFLRQLSENVALRADVRYRWDDNSTDAFNKSSFGDWLLNVGVNIALGRKAQPAPAAQPAPQPVAQVAPEPAAPPPQPAPEPAPALRTPQANELNGARAGDVVVLLEGVNFEFDSARLLPNATEILDESVTVLNRRPEIKVDIVGHTCNIGTDQYNQGLSERRAQSVYDYLVANGIAPDRLTTRGMGETQPAHSNATREGRAKNRRVELHVR